jgi:excisionase family DNA binding protein
MQAVLEQVFLTPEQVAEQLQVATTTVYRWLRAGKLGGAKVSHKAWRVSNRDLEAFVSASPRITPHVRTRSLEQEWLRRHEAEYAGSWVALEGAHLIAYGTSAREVLELARSHGFAQPLVSHVPEEPELLSGGW